MHVWCSSGFDGDVRRFDRELDRDLRCGRGLYGDFRFD
jgi:hypothetical protein